MISKSSRVQGVQAAVLLFSLGAFSARSSLGEEPEKNSPNKSSSLIAANTRARENISVNSLPDRFKLPLHSRSLIVLPSGEIIISGKSENLSNGGKPSGNEITTNERSFIWKADTAKWTSIEQAGLGGNLAVSPLNNRFLSLGGRDGFISKDGGSTWQQAFPQFVEFEGKQIQINQTFWSHKEQSTLFLAQIAVVGESRILKLDTNSGKITNWSKTDGFFSRYSNIGARHFGWLGPADRMPAKCVVSDDDGKTWNPIDPDLSPWTLHASAQRQVGKMLNLDQIKMQAVRPVVKWAVEISGVAFCQIESIVGEKLAPHTPTIFTSSDHGKTWTPAALQKRTPDIRTIFAQSPFITKQPGAESIDPNTELIITIDPKTQRIYAEQGGEWFVTTASANEWNKINIADPLGARHLTK